MEGMLWWWLIFGTCSPSSDEGSVEPWVETEGCVVVAVPTLAACDREEGTEARAACFWLWEMLCRLAECLPGDDDCAGIEGEPRLLGVPPLVTKMVVRLSSLLPRRELG